MDLIMDNIQLIISIATLGGIVFAIYKTFSDPDVKAATRLEKIEVACPLKHEKLDYVVSEIKSSIKSLDQSMLLIKENDIKHIENEMRRMSDVQTKILTILEERKNNQIK